MNKVDLHLHSIYSDGEDTIEELIKKIKIAGIGVFSITDHDNIASHSDLRNIKDINYIPSVEMSCIYKNIKLHLLGYGIKENGDLSSVCNDLVHQKRELIKEIIDDLISKGYNFKQEDIFNLFKIPNKSLTKVDVARLLVKYQKVKTVNEAYKSILTPYKIGNKIRNDADYIASLIEKDDGICILAHPGEIEKRYEIDILDVLDELIDIGISGIEVFNSKHTSHDVIRFLQIAKDKKLLISGGSDYHGLIAKPHIKIGKGIMEEEISEKILKKSIRH